MYAPVEIVRSKALEPAGKDRNWFTLMPMSNKARASHCIKIMCQISLDKNRIDKLV